MASPGGTGLPMEIEKTLATTKLSPTQAAMLQEVTSKGSLHIDTFYGRGSQGGRLRGGQGRANTALKLVCLGLIKLTRSENGMVPQGNGYTVHYHDAWFALATTKTQEG